MIQQNNENDAGTIATQGWPYGLIAGEGQRALAILLAAGWSVLASFGAEREHPSGLSQHLDQALERLREEISRTPEVIDSLLGLAGQLFPTDRLSPPLPPGFAPIVGSLHPHLGPLQKEQAHSEALRHALDEYRTAGVRYTQKLSELFEAALSEYQHELAAIARSEPGACSTRELHERWIEVAERTYERFLDSEEYTRAIGELMNAWTELRLALQPVVDELLRHLGLPSRRDVEDTQLHLDRLRREQRADTKRLQREVQALRQELAALRPDAPSCQPRPGARRDDRS